MREQKQKKVRRAEETEDETAPKKPADTELDQETSDVLDDIACCLAEVEEENDLAAKRAAKAEWDELWRKYGANEINSDEAIYQRDSWALKYAGLFPMKRDCCGNRVPDFSGLE